MEQLPKIVFNDARDYIVVFTKIPEPNEDIEIDHFALSPNCIIENIINPLYLYKFNNHTMINFNFDAKIQELWRDSNKDFESYTNDVLNSDLLLRYPAA